MSMSLTSHFDEIIILVFLMSYAHLMITGYFIVTFLDLLACSNEVLRLYAVVPKELVIGPYTNELFRGHGLPFLAHDGAIVQLENR